MELINETGKELRALSRKCKEFYERNWEELGGTCGSSCDGKGKELGKNFNETARNWRNFGGRNWEEM